MTLNQLKIFDLVATHLNISKAAREIKISQPTISKQLRLLEDEYGVKFHTKISQGIALTPQGRVFLSAIQPILRQLDILKSTFSMQKLTSKILTVGATQSPSVSLIPRIVKTFRQAHPDIQSIVRVGDSRLLEQMLLKSEVDLAIVTYPSYHPRTVVEKIWSGEIAAVVFAKYSMAKKSKLSQEEFMKIPLVVKMGGRIAAFIKEKGLDPNIVMQCESTDAVKAAVESGIGIGLLYRENVDYGLKSGQLKTIHIPCLKEMHINWFMVYRQNEDFALPVQDFINLLRRWSH